MNKSVLPRGKAGQACGYTPALWKRLTCFLDNPQSKLNNNRAENSVRPVAAGRKNWIHIGGKDAGFRVAAILSVVESCCQPDIPVRQYLAAVLPGLADRPIQNLAEITPTAWAAKAHA